MFWSHTRTARWNASAWLLRRWKSFLKPGIPERCLAGDGFGGLVAVEVEGEGDHARAAAVEGAEGGDAGTGFVDAQKGVVGILGVELDDAAEGGDAGPRGCRPALADLRAFESQGGG